MDSGDAGELTARGRAALPWIASAVAVIVIAGGLYLRASAPPANTAHVAPSPMATLAGAYAADYSFVTPSTGWAFVGATTSTSTNPYWIFKTTDGAAHWRLQFASSVDSTQTSLDFFDAENGVVLFSNPTPYFLRTKDGGAHWQQLPAPGAPVAMWFADPAHGWALTAPPFALSLTTHGGSEWTAASWPSDSNWGGTVGQVDGMPFRSNGEGWLGMEAGGAEVYLTTDGGVSWTPVAVPAAAAAQPSPQPGEKQLPPGVVPFVTQVRLMPGNGVLVSATDSFGDQTVLETFDRGDTWRKVPPPPNPMRYDDIAFLDSTHWWAFRFGSLFKTSDSGLSWREAKVAPLIDGWDYGVAHVIDSQHAWATMQTAIIPGVRTFSTALSTTSDGGATWHYVAVPKPPA